ncbi:minor capsid protein [Staphylococcus simiae]|uniref:minor capsid protein n=1 Tax=Staphylococcus simiae TaxID=308354 RepID=UPI001A96D8C4|nr:minor capsid protein [Staphylococcus simiae]MBO1199109.1 minor capsid protein [Staphylococcus simiae]MBO1201183.1 minor capsid protein [Staphylococcus simiae]MBO1203331.1 minor capsid protein [Staphylococcus simiae]MBO1210859.1 minor capsid protein [Staphylococcus simiae]MBO1229547.1 minor capsid protein [Staphylococcus simiae]
MTETSEYWLTRAQNVIDAEAQEDAKAMTDIERIILLMYAEIAREILAFYAKYAQSQGLVMQEAIKVADQFDVVAFQQQAKKLVETKDFSDEANIALKAYNTKMNISREKLLKQQLDLIVKRSGIDIEHKIEDKLVDAVDREVKRQAGILGEHVKIDDTHVKAVVNSNFKGVTWSKRLWKDMAQVQKEVERITSHVVLRGRHPNEFVSTFKKKTNATTFNAKRLLITESARVQAEAQKLTYLKELGEDAKYKYVAKIDSKTSKLCHSLNGEVFKVKDMMPGVNAPPMHPFCRSTTVPHVGNWRDQFFKERRGKYKLEVNSEELQQNAKKEMLEMIKDGRIKLELNHEKQNRHQKGHELFERNRKYAMKNGSKLPSYTTLSNEELNNLIKKHSTKGDLIINKGSFNHKEIINFNKIIGKTYINGKYYKTPYGKVHYSKTGVHIVPHLKRNDNNEN